MAVFGLGESEVSRLVAPLRIPSCSDPRLERGDSEAVSDADLFARAAWTGLSEPGDRSAGVLTMALGAPGALTALLEGWSAERLARAVDPAATVSVAALRKEFADALARWRPRMELRDVIRSLEVAARRGCRLVTPAMELWPVGVDDLGANAPIALWWRGRSAALHSLSFSIALVGARAATGYGEHVAMEASAGLVDRGLAIVSGAAYGIDGMAHRSAIASEGHTIAFLAGGVDRFYPRGHDALLGRICEVGAVVSELPCGSTPTKWRFLQRNRLIAASSQATVVLEAGWRSGSLNTAGHAAALGRPLGAVPGPVTSPASAGCHRLLREYDARCVSNAAEMAELVRSDDSGAGGGAQSPGVRQTGEETRVIDALSARSPRVPLDIAQRSGLSTTTVLGTLGTLELAGIVRERHGGWVRASPG
ncbi:DNA-processing protein DprA [Luethyella okanaganae]|uniref:DNA-processing protein DprA n=1 Tax=Luethyella okanaganae TaxID=69372 RepID=A0ABW1VEH4_9MICO